MTDDEALEYRKLLDRKKKALSLPDVERERFIDEYNRIAKAVKDMFPEYCFYKIGLKISEEQEEILYIFFGMDDLWNKLTSLEKLGEGKKIDVILEGMKHLYKAIKEIEA